MNINKLDKKVNLWINKLQESGYQILISKFNMGGFTPITVYKYTPLKSNNWSWLLFRKEPHFIKKQVHFSNFRLPEEGKSLISLLESLWFND